MIPLLFRNLKDKRWALLGWSLGALAMTWLTIVFFPTISDNSSLDELSKNAPAQLQGILGNALSWHELNHYIGEQVLNLRLPTVTLIFAVILGLSLSVNEEDTGTLKTLQTLAIGRSKVVIAKWLVVIISSLVIAIASGASILIGVASIGDSVPLQRVVEASFLMWLLVAGTASLTLMLGLASGKKGLTTLIASLFVAANILLPTLAAQVKGLQEAAKFTLYHYYEQPAIFVSPLNWKHVAILLTVVIASLFVALFFYRRRDISV